MNGWFRDGYCERMRVSNLYPAQKTGTPFEIAVLYYYTTIILLECLRKYVSKNALAFR